MPVFEGAFSSFLAFLMLGLSEFAYVRKYFFTVYLAIVILGLLNGLVLLPSFLAIFGTSRDPPSDDPRRPSFTVKRESYRHEEEEEEVKTQCRKPSLHATSSRMSRKSMRTPESPGGRLRKNSSVLSTLSGKTPMREHLDHLGRAEAAKADWRTLTRTLTTPDFDNEDPDLMGARPPESQQKHLDDVDNPEHAHNQKTKLGRFVGVLKQFPIFWVQTNLGITIPTAVQCAVAILYGVLMEHTHLPDLLGPVRPARCSMRRCVGPRHDPSKRRSRWHFVRLRDKLRPVPEL